MRRVPGGGSVLPRNVTRLGLVRGDDGGARGVVFFLVVARRIFILFILTAFDNLAWFIYYTFRN
jgi:hypothetical protein